MNLIILDTETTGFKAPRLIELAYARRGAEISSFRCRPPIPIEDQAVLAHGISNEMLLELPLFSEHPEYQIVKEIFENEMVIAHNAPYDIGVLAREGITVRYAIDTKKCVKQLYPEQPDHKLQGLRERFNIEVEGQAHSAAGDVMVLAALFERMVQDLMKDGYPEEDAIARLAQIG